MIKVDRVKDLTENEIQKYVRENRPVILTEAIKHWKASQDWDLDYFKENYGDDMVSIRDGSFRDLTQLPLSAYIDFIKQLDMRDLYKYWAATPYMQDWLALEMHPELKEHIELPKWVVNWERKAADFFGRTYNGLPYTNGSVFIGPAGATTYLHQDRDHTHAWLAQIEGRKKWTMFPPDQAPYLKSRDNDPHSPQPHVNIDHPNFDLFPDFKKATPIEIVLEPGELIFFPSGWWHQVTSLDPTISVTGNFVNGSNIMPYLKARISDKLKSVNKTQVQAPKSLIKAYEAVQKNTTESELNVSGDKVVLNMNWRDYPVQISATAGATSFTFKHYEHGRSYTSFFAEQQTDLSDVGLNEEGKAAADKLLDLAPKKCFKVLTAFAISNVVLFGQIDDPEAHLEKILEVIQSLTESFPRVNEAKEAVSV